MKKYINILNYFYCILLSCMIPFWVSLPSFGEDLKNVDGITVKQSENAIDLKIKANKSVKINTSANKKQVTIAIPQSELKGSSVQDFLAQQKNSKSLKLLKVKVSRTAPKNSSPTVYMELNFDRPVNSEVIDNDTKNPSIVIKGNQNHTTQAPSSTNTVVAASHKSNPVKNNITPTNHPVNKTVLPKKAVVKTPTPVIHSKVSTTGNQKKYQIKTKNISKTYQKKYYPQVAQISPKSPSPIVKSLKTANIKKVISIPSKVKNSVSPNKPATTVKKMVKASVSPTLKPSNTASPVVKEVKNISNSNVVESRYDSSQFKIALRTSDEPKLMPKASPMVKIESAKTNPVEASPSTALIQSNAPAVLMTPGEVYSSVIYSSKPNNKKDSKLASYDLLFFIISLLLLSLLVFVSIYFMVPWIIDTIKRFKSKETSSDNAKTLEVVSVSPTKAVHIVESENKLLLYEVEGGKKTLLTEITDPNLIATLKNKGFRARGSNFIAEYLKKIAVSPLEQNSAIKKNVSSSKFDFTITDDDDLMAPQKPTVSKPAPIMPDQLTAPAAPSAKISKMEPVAPHGIMSTLEKAMDKFAQNNPDDDLANLPKSNIAQPKKETPFITPFKPRQERSAVSPFSKPVPMEEEDKFPEPKSNVHDALSQVRERQNKRLTMIRDQKERIGRGNQFITNILDKKHEIDTKLRQVNVIVQNIDIRSVEPIDRTLIKTFNDLQQLENELIQLITDTSVIRKLIEEEGGEGNNVLSSFFESVPEMFTEIKKYNKQLSQIKQARERVDQEQSRVVTLLRRKKELEDAIAGIRRTIDQIEESNREIIQLDSNALPEQVPMVVINELKRLEFELQAINNEPGMNSQF